MKYLKSKLPDIAVFLIGFAAFFAVIALSRLDTGAVLYALLLFITVTSPFYLYKYVNEKKKCKKLNDLIKQDGVIIENGSLPETSDITELCYRQLVLKLAKEKQRISLEFVQKRTETEDYYTLWAHQIKTPIAAMRLLLQSNEGTPNRECEAELFKIEQYVEMVLGFQRLESDSNDYVLKTYDIDGIIKTSVKKFSKQFILKKLTFNFSETHIKAVTDEKQLGFVIEQIISNALKYTPSGSISVYGEGDTLCISDTGIGIADEDLPRIFEKGYTGYNGRTDKKSTGLGLYLCKRITDKLGHKLTVYSKEGEGTTVKIKLSRPTLEIE